MCYTADVGEHLFLMAVEHYTLTLFNSTIENRNNTNNASKNASNGKYLVKPLDVMLLIINFLIYYNFQKYL